MSLVTLEIQKGKGVALFETCFDICENIFLLFIDSLGEGLYAIMCPVLNLNKGILALTLWTFFKPLFTFLFDMFFVLTAKNTISGFVCLVQTDINICWTCQCMIPCTLIIHGLITALKLKL